MKNIEINTHNCSREELAELKAYLDSKCWDYKEVEKENKKPLWVGAELELNDSIVKVLIGIDQEDGNSLEYTTTADIDYHKEWGRKNGTPWTSSKEDLVVSRNSDEVIFDEEHDLIMSGVRVEPRPFTCHSFVTDGKIQYLNDCTHEYAGQTIELEDIK